MIVANHGTAVPNVQRPQNPILRYWRGEGPLWKIYWLYGVLGSTLLAGLYWAALDLRLAWLQQLLLPLLGAYTVWIVVAVWRCAFNTREEFYGHLARALTIAWAINAALLLFFLELGLLARLAH